jgi:hypothetical protein
MSNKRDQLAREIADTVPAERLYVAACLMLRWHRTDLPRDASFVELSKDEVLRFIASLNVRDLVKLRRVALSLHNGGGIVGRKH